MFFAQTHTSKGRQIKKCQELESIHTQLPAVVWAPIITKFSSKKAMCTKEKGLFTCTPIKTWCFPKKWMFTPFPFYYYFYLDFYY